MTFCCTFQTGDKYTRTICHKEMKNILSLMPEESSYKYLKRRISKVCVTKNLKKKTELRGKIQNEKSVILRQTPKIKHIKRMEKKPVTRQTRHDKVVCK